MGYYTYLKRLLKPLCVYAPEGVNSNAELEALGGALDEACRPEDLLAAECTVPTASDYGLASYEAILPCSPVTGTLADRRGAVCALLQIDETSFTQTALNATLSGCGVPARVAETDAKYTVRVTFPGVRGEPADFASVRLRVEAILPCHLDVEYSFTYLSWSELEAAFASWSALEGGPADWHALSCWP